jgi:hypothetical protein
MGVRDPRNGCIPGLDHNAMALGCAILNAFDEAHGTRGDVFFCIAPDPNPNHDEFAWSQDRNPISAFASHVIVIVPDIFVPPEIANSSQWYAVHYHRTDTTCHSTTYVSGDVEYKSDWPETHARRRYTTATRWSGLGFDNWFQALSPGESKEEGMPAWFTDTDSRKDGDMSLTGPLALTWSLIRLLEIVGVAQLPSQVHSVCEFWGELFAMVESGDIEAVVQKLGRDLMPA